jgi:hypothetical protein
MSKWCVTLVSGFLVGKWIALLKDLLPAELLPL